MMRTLLLACLLSTATLPAHAAAAEGSACPGLPAKSGLAWKQVDGPDFTVCRAMHGQSQYFGIYLGGHPSYLHLDKDRAETGKVGPYEVIWYNVAADSARGEFARETLIRFGESDSDGVAHVWISAANAEEFAASLKALEGLKFKAPPAVEAPAEPVAEPAAESAAEPTIEPIAEPAAEAAAEPATVPTEVPEEADSGD